MVRVRLRLDDMHRYDVVDGKCEIVLQDNSFDRGIQEWVSCPSIADFVLYSAY